MKVDTDALPLPPKPNETPCEYHVKDGYVRKCPRCVGLTRELLEEHNRIIRHAAYAVIVRNWKPLYDAALAEARKNVARKGPGSRSPDDIERIITDLARYAARNDVYKLYPWDRRPTWAMDIWHDAVGEMARKLHPLYVNPKTDSW
jgi:hypothetical protein